MVNDQMNYFPSPCLCSHQRKSQPSTNKNLGEQPFLDFGKKCTAKCKWILTRKMQNTTQSTRAQLVFVTSTGIRKN